MLKNFKNKPMKIIVMLLGTLVICWSLIGVYNFSNYGNGFGLNSSVGQIEPDFDTGGETVPASEFKGEDSIAVYDEDLRDDGDSIISEDKVIKSASIDFKVNNLDKARKDIDDLMMNEDGVMSNLQEYGTDNERVISLVVKVPSDRFNFVMKSLRSMAVEINDVYVTNSDVSVEYVDTAARLSNEKAYEAELVVLLGDAVDVDDVLAIRTELNQVRARVESLQASIDYYDRNVEMSSISVSLSLYEAEFDVDTTVWSPLGVAKSAVSVLLLSLKGIANLFIWLVVFSPLFLVVKGVKMVVRKRKGKK